MPDNNISDKPQGLLDTDFIMFLRNYVLPVVRDALLLFIVFNVFFLHFYVPTGSMRPTIAIDSHGLAIRSWIPYTINRGDILVFQSDELEEILIKRTIGLPGDQVSIRDGIVTINGDKLDESYVIHTSYETMDFIVPDEYYLFLGDNRAASHDARFWENPFIHKSKIKARAILFAGG